MTEYTQISAEVKQKFHSTTYIIWGILGEKNSFVFHFVVLFYSVVVHFTHAD